MFAITFICLGWIVFDQINSFLDVYLILVILFTIINVLAAS